MIIRSMTATFGKLEHETLTLKPGLNIIFGDNEWGKSTWCAFLADMFYGVDTRAKSTKMNLADKERFAPWSGSPMSGQVELTWRGRDITIERRTNGRIPMGAFRAYETETGLPVPELTGGDCGIKLLGVERSVFVRTAFIRFRDMAITDDEALRRRLNNLVTTGDENSGADYLNKNLRELKNRIRYNRSGLLPQAEAERERLEQRMQELEQLKNHCDQLQRRLDQVEDWRMALENHRASLAYEEAREDARKVARAKQTWENACRRLEELSALCGTLPEKETVRDSLTEFRRLEEARRTSEEELRQLRSQEKSDTHRWGALRGRMYPLLIFALILAAVGAMLWKQNPVPGMVCCGGGLVLLVCWLAAGLLRREGNPEEMSPAQRVLEEEIGMLKEKIRDAEFHRVRWEDALGAWDALEKAVEDSNRAREHLETLQSMARTAPAPEFADRMDYGESETVRLLEECSRERGRLEKLLGQYQGKMDALASAEDIAQQLDRINSRIGQLEMSWQALTIAQETLAEAQNRLQRRFAPRIVRRAEDLMGRMTGGRYQRLSLGEDFSIRSGAEGEDTLQSVLWRSDGTADQLYLALRLAVSGEVMPGSPLILDDALVRFDDRRLKAALDILRDEAGNRQVILFTCHSREASMV